MEIPSDLKKLEKLLQELRKTGVNLSKRENHQIAEAVKTDIQRDVPKQKRKTFGQKLLKVSKDLLPLLGPILKAAFL